MAVVLGAVALGGCVGSSGPAAGTVPVMGSARVNAFQMVAWFNSRQPQPAGVYNATVPLAQLAQTYLDEGAAEGVAGDVAFIQSIVETGWFRFGGAIPPSYNNFAGIGATGPTATPAQFPDATTGVRAQIQHLRAYADASATSCTVPPLHHACVDPRFNLVSPKGKASTWNQMGNGNWAASSTYATSILTLYAEMLTFNHVPVP